MATFVSGLSAIKNVGEGAVEAVLEARRAGGAFRSLFDFCDRVDSRAVNRRVVESFIKSGSFDETDSRRAALFAAIDPAMESGQKRQRDRESGQTSLFGGPEPAVAAQPERVADAPPGSEAERLAFEKESLGFFISGHPLERHRRSSRSGRAPRPRRSRSRRRRPRRASAAWSRRCG